MESKNYIVIDMHHGNYALGHRSIHPGVDYAIDLGLGSFSYITRLANDLNAQTAHPPKGRVAKVAALLFALFLALGAAAQTNTIIEQVVPSFHMVGSLTMLDGRVFQVQEAILFTNTISVVQFEGQLITNVLKTVQGPVLTNFCDYRFVRTDALPPLPSRLR